jgi:hypothetical protein
MLFFCDSFDFVNALFTDHENRRAQHAASRDKEALIWPADTASTRTSSGIQNQHGMHETF